VYISNLNDILLPIYIFEVKDAKNAKIGFP